MDNKTDYIKPTKDHPIFKCFNDYFGYIENTIYKEWEIHEDNKWIVGSTFEVDLSRAILKLHDYIKEHKETLKSNTKFTIVMMDGSLNNKGEINEVKCYSISMKQAKKFKLI